LASASRLDPAAAQTKAVARAGRSRGSQRAQKPTNPLRRRATAPLSPVSGTAAPPLISARAAISIANGAAITMDRILKNSAVRDIYLGKHGGA
jgi:hypothetical protein